MVPEAEDSQSEGPQGEFAVNHIAVGMRLSSAGWLYCDRKEH